MSLTIWQKPKIAALILGAALVWGATIQTGHASEMDASSLFHTADQSSPNAVSDTGSGTGPAISMGQVLAPADAERYAAAFALQDSGDWDGADRQIAGIRDRLLLGSLLAQRYLSPGYHTTLAQARAWLTTYRDLPEAHAIWALARHRAPRKAASLPRPATGADAAVADDDDGSTRLPAEPTVANLQPPPRYTAGLRAWRAQRFGEAAADFESVAHSSSAGGWYIAAGAFWAARAHLVLEQPEVVDSWLEMAADQPRTFYGLLAHRLLDEDDTETQFGPQPLSAKEEALLRALPGGRRALALVQVGETDRAEAELRVLAIHASAARANAIVALADITQMPSLCMALGPRVSDARRRTDALYPVPRWQPRHGYTVDRALMFALMMQESNFDAEAESGSGAAGLMQLMPRTARDVARRSGIHLRSVSELVDPELNLSLGQEFVRQLLSHEEVHGNLILMLAAYNGGTGALDRWRNAPQYRNDPLLFVESLPRQETRLYVERVLTNMWIYRERLGQPVPDLDELAQNHWPTYVSLNRIAANGTGAGD
jgi:soluble lytic murein transglycosylase-like protein